MARYYVADDGTIHERLDQPSRPSVSRRPVDTAIRTHRPDVPMHRKAIFWVITLLNALVIGYCSYLLIGTGIIPEVFNPEDLYSVIRNFYSSISPYVITGGTVISAIIYGRNKGPRNSYNLGTYFMSALVAAICSVGIEVFLVLMSMLTWIGFYVLAIHLVISFLRNL